MAPDVGKSGRDWFDEDFVQDLMARAWKRGSEELGVQQAQEWARDDTGTPFRFTDEELSRDATELKSLGLDLDKLITAKQDRLRAKGRLSMASVDATLTPETISNLADKEDIVRIRELVGGVQIPTSDDFVPQEEPEPLRPKYRTLMPTVHKLLHKQAQQGSILVLPAELLLMAYHLQPYHHQSLGWTKKAGEPAGRVTGDMSFAFSPWVTSLNGMTKRAKDEVRRKVEEKWGVIKLPTLDDIVHDINAMADEHGWDAISLFKKDIAAAFHRLLFDPGSVTLTAFALDDLYTILHLVGNFGWTGMPNAWDVIGRIMLAAAKGKISGTLKLYVDDFFGVCLTRFLRSNNVAIDGVIRTLLGEEALAPKKDKEGRVLVILGWLFNLDTRTVAISEDNLLKTLHAFMVLNPRRRVTLLMLQRAASLATRYSTLARSMAQFAVEIYKDIAMFKGKKHDAKRKMSSGTKIEVAMWLAYLPLTAMNPLIFARSLDSFRPKPPTAVNFSFDGSLLGVGSGVRESRDEPRDRDVDVSNSPDVEDLGELLGFAGIHPLPCTYTTDSSYQNTFELVGVNLCLLIAAFLGLSNFSLSATGDSKTTLSWLVKDRVNSSLGKRAAMVYSILTSALGAFNTGTKFLKSVDNFLMDQLSRGVLSAAVRALPSEKRFVCGPGSPAYKILALCDPQAPELTLEETLTFASTIASLLKEVQEEGRVHRNSGRSSPNTTR